jgi:hypothetical protein
MEIRFFCTYWGSEHLAWPAFLAKVKDAGYDGVEASLPENPELQKKMRDQLNDAELEFIAVHWDTITPDFNQHKKETEIRLNNLALTDPVFITSHTGKDHFSFKQNMELLLLAEEISMTTGMQILHETHRGKFSYAPGITQSFLEALPSLQLTLDISHWFTVSESFLEDQTASVTLALSRTRHIHSRIGFTQGPQVTDPRNLEYREAVENHLKYWDRIVSMQKEKGKNTLTITSEFGPFPYMTTSPAGISAENHQWDLNYYMKELLKSRYYAD